MDTIVRGFSEALNLIASMDADLIEILVLSLVVSGVALGLSIVSGIPLGVILGLLPIFRTGYCQADSVEH